MSREARALILNVGSGTLKWTLFRLPQRERLAERTESWQERRAEQLRDALGALPRFDEAGHRLVHGGTRFRETVRLDAPVRAALEPLRALAPLHMDAALTAIDLLTEFHPDLPQFAAFDTAFHATLPDAAACYALPREWTQSWELKRFGFHGLSVESALREVSARLGRVPRDLIVCHLGSGCSVTAVHEGRSVDTTMGFSPLEGLMMGTRAGSVDPGLLLHLLTARGLEPHALRAALENESGLLGMSGVSADLREVIAAMRRGSPDATLAYERFVLDVRRGIGAMAGALGRVDALAFTGGIGENSASVRAAAAPALAGHGLLLDDVANRSGAEGVDLARPDSKVRLFAVRAREDEVILDHVLRWHAAREAAAGLASRGAVA